jgi:(1->4)-alpha-D-glucan 1-alpha-D-glucosylmutase
VAAAKRELLASDFAPDVGRVVRALFAYAAGERDRVDLSEREIRGALEAYVVCFPSYRSYLRREGAPAPRDELSVRSPLGRAEASAPELPRAAFQLLEDVLLRVNEGSQEAREKKREALVRIQQLTAPLMAKAAEDTAFYRYVRFAALNEVGGDPGRFGSSVAAFHRKNQTRAASWPLTMLASSTHDTKRGEDVRARLAVLSERPELWEALIGVVMAENGRLAVEHPEQPSPSPSALYLAAQTALGALPVEASEGAFTDALQERLAAYMLKAVREAKRETRWIGPDLAYEDGLARRLGDLLTAPAVREALLRCAAAVSPLGVLNSLSATLLKHVCPGVPDTYQGSELWDLSLVDPDNRRPVDFAARARLLDGLVRRMSDRPALCAALRSEIASGAPKLYVTHVALTERRERRSLWQRGDYTALPGGERLVAFSRKHEEDAAICVVPRHAAGHPGARHPWGLSPEILGRTLSVPHLGSYRNAFTGRVHRVTSALEVGDVLAEFPVALLIREEKPRD